MATFYKVITGGVRVGKIGEQLVGRSMPLPDGTRKLLLRFADKEEFFFKLGDLELDLNATAAT